MTTFYAYQRIDQTGKKWWLHLGVSGTVYEDDYFSQTSLFDKPLDVEDYEVIIFDLIPRLPQGS